MGELKLRKVYQKADGSRVLARHVPVLGKLLDRLAAENRLTREEVFAEIRRDPASPLRRYFTWQRDRAAHAYHLVEAGRLIQSVHVVVVPVGNAAPIRVRAFIRVPQAPGLYQTTERVLASVTARDIVLREALAALNAWKLRYEHLAELGDVFAAAERALASVKRKRRAS